MSVQPASRIRDAIEQLLQENRQFPSSAEFAANAVIQPGEYGAANADRPAF